MSKTIVKQEDSVGSVLEYTPRTLERDLSVQAADYIQSKQYHTSRFKLSELVASQVGISELERASLESQVEKQAIEKIKSVQEAAYKEAYALGLEEGSKKAFSDNNKDILAKLQLLDDLLVTVGKMKMDILAQNEVHIMKLIYDLACRLALMEIDKNEARILPVIRHAVELAQSEENVVVRLSKADFDFIETFRESAKKDFEFVKKLKFEQSSEIRPGGCVVETNFGVIDAKMEERISKLWNTIEEKIPKQKDNVEK